MSKQDLTEILCVLDGSGSMERLVQPLVSGFNRFIEEQRQLPGEARVTLAIFDDEYLDVYQSRPLRQVPRLTTAVYTIGGLTRLYDAVGKMMVDMGRQFAERRECERPQKVVVFIFTDGLDNDSRKFNRSKVFEMIEHQRTRYNWQFVFMGANQDSFLEAGLLGIGGHATANVAPLGHSVQKAMVGLSKAVGKYRGPCGQCVSLDQEQY